jgi:quercetin dioxygenase-like cupin family protein
LYVLAGRGRVRTRNEQGEMLEPGDVVYAGSKDWHFHGATRDAPMEHVAVTVGGETEWGEAVSDEEYDQGF